MSKNKYARAGVERYNPRRVYLPKVREQYEELPSGTVYERQADGSLRRVRDKEPVK